MNDISGGALDGHIQRHTFPERPGVEVAGLDLRQGALSGEDFHTVTAAHVFNVPLGQVTANMRRAAKAVNFGIVYGISAFSLSQDLGVTVAEAKEYMDAYFTRFPGVKAYMDGIISVMGTIW